MKNIFELLSAVGITLEGENKATFEKSFLENYKTIAEVSNLTKKIETLEANEKAYKESDAKKDADLKDLQAKLEAAGTDSTKLLALQQELTNLQKERETEKAEFEKKLNAQHYEHLVKEKAGELKFSSASAKKAFIADVLAQNLKVKNDELLDFSDYVEAYKKEDSAAFLTEQSDNGGAETQPKPTFTTQSTQSAQTAPAEVPLLF